MTLRDLILTYYSPKVGWKHPCCRKNRHKKIIDST